MDFMHRAKRKLAKVLEFGELVVKGQAQKK
jgi:hypothetical protein